MTGDELREARERAGMSLDDLAEEMCIPTARLAAWESGRRRTPRRQAATIKWLAALAERERAMDQSGLPKCAWLTEWEQRLVADPAAADLQVLEDHVRRCSTCQAREAATKRKDPLPPFPEPKRDVLFRAIGLYEASTARIGVLGTVLTMIAVLVVFGSALSLAPHHPAGEVGAYLLAVAFAAVIGVSTYHANPLRRFGAMSRWLTRCIAGSLAMTSFAWAFVFTGYGSALFLPEEGSTWIAGVRVGIAMGCLYGTAWPLGRFLKGGRLTSPCS